MGIYIAYRCIFKDISISNNRDQANTSFFDHLLSYSEIFKNILKCIGISSIVIVLIFGPVLYTHPYQAITSMITRMFPFGRGLVHDYWAPNIWAFYMFLDRILTQLCLRIPLVRTNIKLCSLSISNTLQTYDPKHLSILPTPTPLICAISVICCTVPLGIFYFRTLRILFKKSLSIDNTTTVSTLISQYFINILIFGWFISFLFGFHVHEKAAIYGLLPLYLTIPQFVSICIPKTTTKNASTIMKIEYNSILLNYIQYCKYLSLTIYVSFLPLIMIPITEQGTNWTGLERFFLITLCIVYYQTMQKFWSSVSLSLMTSSSSVPWYKVIEQYIIYSSLFMVICCLWNISFFISLPFLPLVISSLVTGIILLYSLGGIAYSMYNLWSYI